MFGKRESVWAIDPSKVEFGSVVAAPDQNLSRTHVRVRYRTSPSVEFLPFETFMRSCNAAMREGKPLKIEHMRVAPILKQLHPSFFNRLTDWRPAMRRAVGHLPATQLRVRPRTG